MLEVRFLPQAAKYLKKIKDKRLLNKFKEAIDKISIDYTVGDLKKGDLSGIYSFDIYYQKTNYELAYVVKEIQEKIIIVILAGTRENFYEQLKKYIR